MEYGALISAALGVEVFEAFYGGYETTGYPALAWVVMRANPKVHI